MLLSLLSVDVRLEDRHVVADVLVRGLPIDRGMVLVERTTLACDDALEILNLLRDRD